MPNNASPDIHRITELDLVRTDWRWPFAEERRTEIAAHFAAERALRPQMFNGRVLLARRPSIAASRLSGRYFETDFASFLAWRDWGFPDREVMNGFGMGALRSCDGAFVLGEMGAHTSNAGRVYFASGTPDLDDLRGDSVDISGSVLRELEEELGLTSDDVTVADDWHCVITAHAIAMMRVLTSALTGDALRARLRANLAAQSEPELCDIHLVRSAADITPAMPIFVTAFLRAQFAP